MKKLVLIGEINDVMRSVYDCLISEFSVQLCANIEESIYGIMKIFRPDIVVLGCFGTEDIQSKIFELLCNQYSHLPVLVISDEEKRHKYEEYCTKKQFELLLRPTTNTELLNRCLALAHIMRTEEGESNEESVKEEEPKKKLLIVDDSPLMLRNLKSLLEDRYIVFLATSGEQALKFIPKKEPDLVLLDYEMPGMDGKETFEIMMEDDFSKNIPVIFLTSISSKEQILDVLKYRPADYILKPPSKEDLLERIEAVWNKSE